MTDWRKPHFAYIECARGYAVLLVILCHATNLFPNLPYPVHRVTVLGWHGVQLFFLASVVTLMMSWRHEKNRNGSVDVVGFFLRRFFRIAPAYYLAAVLYFFLEPPAGGFDPVQALASCLFINALHPVLMGAAPGTWTVVPGGWSIGVEFIFYAAFPLLAHTVTSLSRAVGLFLAAVVAGGVLNALLWPSLEATIGAVPASNFLYFWFPNQMSVFALGFCLFFLLERDRDRGSVLATYPTAICALSLAIVVSTAFLPLPQWLDPWVALPPKFLVASLGLTLFMLALARSRPGVFLNGPVALMGRVSFSAYLLHFAVLKIAADQPFLKSYLDASGGYAIAAFAFGVACVVLVTLAASWCTYRLIETPMINAGKVLIRRRRAVVAQGMA